MYTATPKWAKLNPEIKTGFAGIASTFSGLAAIILPEGRRDALADLQAKKKWSYRQYLQKSTMKPDDQLACFDNMFYVADREPMEWEQRDSPAWNLVGTRVHFSPKVEDVAMEYLRRMFKVAEDEQVPPVCLSFLLLPALLLTHDTQFISVDIRRSDFLAPLSAYKHRIDQMKAEVAKTHGPDSPLHNVTEVVVTGDEQNATWWKEVRAMGYRVADHSQTIVKYGRW